MTKQEFIDELVAECDENMDKIVSEKADGTLVIDVAVVGEIAYELMMELVKAGRSNGNRSTTYKKR